MNLYLQISPPLKLLSQNNLMSFFLDNNYTIYLLSACHILHFSFKSSLPIAKAIISDQYGFKLDRHVFKLIQVHCHIP